MLIENGGCDIKRPNPAIHRPRVNHKRSRRSQSCTRQQQGNGVADQRLPFGYRIALPLYLDASAIASTYWSSSNSPATGMTILPDAMSGAISSKAAVRRSRLPGIFSQLTIQKPWSDLPVKSTGIVAIVGSTPPIRLQNTTLP